MAQEDISFVENSRALTVDKKMTFLSPKLDAGLHLIVSSR